MSSPEYQRKIAEFVEAHKLETSVSARILRSRCGGGRAGQGGFSLHRIRTHSLPAFRELARGAGGRLLRASLLGQQHQRKLGGDPRAGAN